MAFYVKEDKKGKSLRTTEFIPAGKIIGYLDRSKVSNNQTYQSIQVGKDKHFLENSFFSNINHSCDPTTIIDTKNNVCIAIRDIYSEEEINFFYPSTEWKMIQPFSCKCGAKNCIQYIEGAYKIPIYYLQMYFINEHIKLLIEELMNNNTLNYKEKNKISTICL